MKLRIWILSALTLILITLSGCGSGTASTLTTGSNGGGGSATPTFTVSVTGSSTESYTTSSCSNLESGSTCTMQLSWTNLPASNANVYAVNLGPASEADTVNFVLVGGYQFLLGTLYNTCSSNTFTGASNPNFTFPNGSCTVNYEYMSAGSATSVGFKFSIIYFLPNSEESATLDASNLITISGN